MTALVNSHLITIDEYLTGEVSSGVKHEFLGGSVYAMAGGTNQHNAITGNSFGILYGVMRGKPCQPFNSDTKIRIEFSDHTRFYYPDTMVVCDPNPETDHFQERPVVIVEVLSESTRRTDLGEKRDAYLTIPSLKVLLFVETEAAVVLVHRRVSEKTFEVEQYTGLDAEIALPEIDAKIPLAELYERVKFAE